MDDNSQKDLNHWQSSNATKDYCYGLFSLLEEVDDICHLFIVCPTKEV